MVHHPGYVCVLCDSGYMMLDPSKVSRIRRIGEATEVATGSSLIVYSYSYDYGIHGRSIHEVFVPADGEGGFEDEVRRALDERSDPSWVDPLGAKMIN